MWTFRRTFFDEYDLSGLMTSLKKLSEIPDEVVEEMLMAEADVVERAQKKELRALGLKHPTGQLEKSITHSRQLKIRRDGSRAVYVYPQGDRKKKGKGKAKPATNAEVGFILEYGAPGRGIPPRPWMWTANEKCENRAIRAAQKVYDGWVDEQGL